MNDPKVHVTDHAIVRYLERCRGLDVDEVRKTIENICQRGADNGAPCVKHNKLRYILVGNDVVTVIKPTSHPTHASLVKAMRRA